MEGNTIFTVKQTQAGDDSGYSCTTSTQSKHSVKSCHSQSPSSGDSYIEERRSNTSKTTENGKISNSKSKSKSTEQPSHTILRDSSGMENTMNQKSNNKSSKSEQRNLTTFEPLNNELFSTDELKQTPSTSKIEFDDSKHLNEDTKRDHDQNDINFLQLTDLCQSYQDRKNTKHLTSILSNEYTLYTIEDTAVKEVNDQEILLQEMIESNKVNDDLFGVVVSMNDGLIIDTSKSIFKNMGYHKDMWQGRSFVEFIHPKDRISFISYVTSVLTDPYSFSKRDGTSSVTYLKPKTNDGFYCNMRRYRDFSTSYSASQRKIHYQICKLTTTFKDLTYYMPTSSSNLADDTKRPQLILIVNAQLVHSAYTCPEEKPKNPVNFITKHNTLFEWCYIDHLIISHFGYLPQNFIGRSIFGFYNSEDQTIIKDILSNMTKDRSISYMGKPYRFKCQNGNFALVQTEWSNFVNPCSGQAEFFIGRHKVIQGPINPDVTTLTDDIKSEVIVTEDEKNTKSIYDTIKKILNKNIHEATEASHQVNNMASLSSDIKKQISKNIQDCRLHMHCLVRNMDTSFQVPLEVDVQPENSLTDHSVMLGEISPHHNDESKSSTETPPSYTQLNYNDNIQRFFNSNLKTNSSDDLTDQSYSKETASEVVTSLEKEKAEQGSLLQSMTPSLSILNYYNFSTSYSEPTSSKSSQKLLTQKTLSRHNKQMEDDLVKRHKNKAKKNKSNEKQNLPDETINISGITHGTKRSNSSAYKNNSSKFIKRKHLAKSSPTAVAQTQDNERSIAVNTQTVARSTQIWAPCQIARDSQTTDDLPNSPNEVNCCKNNVAISNNVMLTQSEYEMAYILSPCEQNQESVSKQLQSVTYATVPVINNIPQNSQMLQPLYLHYNNQLILQQPYQNIQFEQNTMQQNKLPVPIMRNACHQKNKALQVNQEEEITSSDSDCKREFSSSKSSSGWLYEDSSFNSSSLRDKTDSSDREDFSWATEFNNTKFSQSLIRKETPPFLMEDIVSTPDLIFRYQIEHGDINEILRKDLNMLRTLNQPTLLKEQFGQLRLEIDILGASKTLYLEDSSASSSGEDNCLFTIGNTREKNIDYFTMAMVYEENAPLPPSTDTALEM